LNESVISEDSLVNTTFEDSPVLPSLHFSNSGESLPEAGQSPSSEKGCLPNYKDLENVTELELSPLGLRCSGLFPGFLHVPNDMTCLMGLEICCLPGVNLGAELKGAMESSLPPPEVESKTPSSPAVATSDTLENSGEGSGISLAESFSRTRMSFCSSDGNSAPSHSFHIKKPFSHLGSDFVDVEDYLVEPSAGFLERPYPALDSSATSEDFGFRPTCESMPDKWPDSSHLQLPEDPSAIPDSVCLSNSFRPKPEVLKFLECPLSPQPDRSLSFARCRPIPGSYFQRLLSPSPSQSTAVSDSTKSLHLRGGGEPENFSLFRSLGSGKLVGNVERGKVLLNEKVGGCDLAGGWGRNGTWRELCEKMEKRVEKRKELEKIEVEKEAEESEGGFKALLAKAKSWFGKGGDESAQEGEVDFSLAASLPIDT